MERFTDAFPGEGGQEADTRAAQSPGGARIAGFAGGEGPSADAGGQRPRRQ